MFHFPKRQNRWLYAVALCTLGCGAILAGYLTSERLEERRWVANTRGLVGELDAAMTLLDEAESSELGYALTRDEQLLVPFERDGTLALEHLARAGAAFDGEPIERERLRRLFGEVDRVLDSMRTVIAARRSEIVDASALDARSRFVIDDVASIRDTVRAFERDQRRRLEAREASIEILSRRTSWAALVLGLLAFAFLVLASTAVRAARRLQRRAEGQALQANAELQSRLQELVQRARDGALRQRLSEALQLCVSTTEAFTAIGSLLPEIVGPSCGGSLAMLRSDVGQLEVVANWGDADSARSLHGSDANDCCALRCGQPYHVCAPELRLRCTHTRGSNADYICLPLAAHGETLGMLHITLRATSASSKIVGEAEAPDGRSSVSAHTSSEHDGSGRERIDLIKQLAEQIAIALANLALRDRLKQQTIRDALTSTFNRRYFDESLEREVLRGRRHRNGLTLLMLDIDHFKSINDRFGHDAGDEVLRAIADCVSRAVRAEDIVCRFGGEEFAILLPEVTAEVARARAARIVASCRAQELRYRGSEIGPVSVSIGLAICNAASEGGADLVRRADAALYEAKRTGRDRVVESTENLGLDCRVA